MAIKHGYGAIDEPVSGEELSPGSRRNIRSERALNPIFRLDLSAGFQKHKQNERNLEKAPSSRRDWNPKICFKIKQTNSKPNV